MARSLFTALLAITLLTSSPVHAKKITQQSLEKVQSKVQDVVAKVLPATVGIGGVGMPAGGSGVIVSKDGLILTAAHVVGVTGEDIVVFFPDGKRVKAKRLGADNDSDAAMVKITEPGEYPFVDVGDSMKLEENAWMIALGHAGGFQPDRSPPVRLGRVLFSRNRFVTTDCTLIGGDSGGPLFDIEGRVVGIHSNIGASLSSNNHVPIDTFKKSWEALLDGRRWGDQFVPASQRQARRKPDPKSPLLGIIPYKKKTSKDRVRIDVPEVGPAAKAGLKNGDALLAIGDKKINHHTDVRLAIKSNQPGDEVSVKVLRDDVEMEFKVKLQMRAKYERIKKQSELAGNNDSDDAVASEESERASNIDSDDSVTDEEIDAWLKKSIAEAEKLGNTLYLDRRDIRKMGGYSRVTRRLRKLVPPTQFAELMGLPMPRRKTDDHLKQIMTTFTKVVDDASPSVVELFDEDKPIALATAIRENGYFITKASELDDIDEGDEVIAKLNDDGATVSILQKYPKYDLALVKINAEVTPVTWYIPQRDPALGTIVAAAGVDDRPLAVGVISVAERNLSGSDKGYLGVQLAPGVFIDWVEPQRPAQQAGLRRGDKLLSVDGEQVEEVLDFIELIKKRRPGETIELEYKRKGETKTANVTLASREKLVASLPDGLRRYPTGGALSDQRKGYPNALQTDLPIRPQDCGGPVVDLQGRVLGINVARAGRIKSYAIPAETIEELIRNFKFEK